MGTSARSFRGLTEASNERKKVPGFATSLGVVERAEILPLLQKDRCKCQRLGFDYTPAAIALPFRESVAEAIGIFRAAGLKAGWSGQSGTAATAARTGDLSSVAEEPKNPHPLRKTRHRLRHELFIRLDDGLDLEAVPAGDVIDILQGRDRFN